MLLSCLKVHMLNFLIAEKCREMFVKKIDSCDVNSTVKIWLKKTNRTSFLVKLIRNAFREYSTYLPEFDLVYKF